MTPDTDEETLRACLPEPLRTPATTFTRIAVGLSGAGVYRVVVGDAAYVLKLAAASEPIDGWRARLAILASAADAGLAPRLVHSDEAHRAIVSAFVGNRSFVGRYADARTHGAAVVELGRALRRVHELPVPAGVETRDRVEFLAAVWSGLASFPLPAFVGDAVRRVLDETPPPRERALVLAHNDANPTNLVYDGERLLLLDWDTAGPNDPFYDLAAVAVFLRMDDAVCARLFAAYDGTAEPPTALPERFRYACRVIAALCGTMFLHIARAGGHPGGRDGEVLELVDVHGRMRAGLISAGTPDGQWAFGLALVRASATTWAISG